MSDEAVKKIGNLFLKNREELDIDGVCNIASFEEDYLVLNSKLGKITVEGAGLVIEDLSHESGKIKVRGVINAVIFSTDTKKNKRGVFS